MEKRWTPPTLANANGVDRNRAQALLKHYPTWQHHKYLVERCNCTARIRVDEMTPDMRPIILINP